MTCAKPGQRPRFRQPFLIRVCTGIATLCLITALGASCAPSTTEFDPNIESELLKLASYQDTDIPDHIEAQARKDAVAAYYGNPLTRENVVAFFTSITKSRTTALAILENAVSQRVPASLAFAIAYEESEFNPRALGRNPDSVDRGLFQLNSKSFPDLAEERAFDPAVNARVGLEYFKTIFEHAGNEVSALAMYNAGRTRVARGATPQKTLNYIARVLSYEKNISSLFTAKVIAKRSLLQKVRFGLLTEDSSVVFPAR